jgi:hypothetical protein
MHTNLLVIIRVDFGDIQVDQVLIRSFAFGKRCTEDGSRMRHCLSYLKKSRCSVTMEVLYCIPIEFGTSPKLVRLIQMCVNESYSKFRICKQLSDAFLVQNDLEQGDAS